MYPVLNISYLVMFVSPRISLTNRVSFFVLAFCKNGASNLLSSSSNSNPIFFITFSLSFSFMIFYHFVTDIFYNTVQHTLPFSIVFSSFYRVVSFSIFQMFYHLLVSSCIYTWSSKITIPVTCHLLLLFFKHIEPARIKMYPNKDFHIVHVDNQSLESFVASCFSSRLTRKP